MKGLTHQAFAACCAAIAIHAGAIDIPMWVGVPIAGLGGLVPELEHPRSKLGRRVYPLSVLLYQFLGHRGFLHSAAFWALLTGVFWLLNGFADFLPAETWKLLSIGHASHLAGDVLVGGNGVQLLWPMKQRQTIVPGTWSLGGLHEIVLFCIFSLITAYLFGYTWG